MADESGEILRVGSEFDPSGLVRGLDIGAATLEQFEQMVQQVSKALPQLSTEKTFQAAAIAAKQAAATTQQYAAALQAVGEATTNLAGPAPRIIRDKLAELKLLSGQLQQLPPIEDAAGLGAQRMAAGFDAAGAAARRAAESAALWAKLSSQVAGPRLGVIEGMSISGRAGAAGTAGAQAWARGLENLKAANAGLMPAFAASTRASNMMRGSLVTLAASSIGTSSAIGRLAQSALFFAGGSSAVIGTAALILAVAVAYDKLTASARKATEERKRLLEAHRSQLAEVGDPGGVQRTIIAAEEQRLALAKEIATWQRAIVEDAIRGIPTYFEELKLRKLITEQQQVELQLASANAALVRQRAKPAEDLLVGLQRDVNVLKTSEEAVKRLEIANSGLHPVVVKTALAMHDQKVALKAQAEAADDATRALEEMLRVQHAIRVANAGGGNLPQGAGGTPGAGLPITGGLLGGANSEQITESRAKAVDKFRISLEQLGDASKQMTFAEWEQDLRDGLEMLPGGISNAERLAFILTDIGTGAFALADVGRSLGFLGDEAARSIEDVGRLADALAAVAVSASTGNIFGAVAAGASLIGGLLGGGPSENERLLAENNQRLADLKASLDESIMTAGGLTATAEQLAAIGEIPLTPRTVGLPVGVDMEALQRFLDAAGLTVEEWAARIEQITGMDVLDEKGRVVAGTLEQADAAIREMIAAAVEFSDSISARAAQLELEDKFRVAGGGGAITPLDDLQRNRRLLLEGLDMGAGFESRISNLNLDTAEGRKAYLEFLRQLYDMGLAGEFTAEILNDFPNADEVFGEIAEGVDDVIAANEAQAEAALAAAAAAEEAARQFRDAFPTLLDLRRQLSGAGEDVAAQFADMLSGLAFAAPELAQMFAGFSIDDPASREALRQRMLEIVEQMLSGQLGVEQLGITPETFQVFLDFLLNSADLLDTFGESIEDATKSILNAPKGFNLEAFEFQAQAAGGPYQWPQDRIPPPEPFRGTDGAAQPVLKLDETAEVTLASLDANIAKLAEALLAITRGDSEEAARKLVSVLRRHSMARGGTPDGRGY